ncbi:hypothetical protein GCM10010082_06760 [Kushneria pakistanensis]|uniref:DUF333 domain-containing protein n=1 Tax=Kushneria pakistanensis TaxID=1508770 RepID=A0ABQ3FD16_9GAMM|nr:hypothetical protein GCM10010082_06760 [Kushneria pakistanensis]
MCTGRTIGAQTGASCANDGNIYTSFLHVGSPVSGRTVGSCTYKNGHPEVAAIINQAMNASGNSLVEMSLQIFGAADMPAIDPDLRHGGLPGHGAQ